MVEPGPVLRFATGKIGCVLPLALLAAGFFAWGSLNVEALGEGRRGGLFRALAPFEAGGVNLPVLALALWILWEFVRMGLRWADGTAAEARPEGLLLHGTLLRRRLVPWAEVRDVRFRMSRQQWTTVPEVAFELGRRTVRVRGIDNDGAAAERFVEAVRERIGARPSS